MKKIIAYYRVSTKRQVKSGLGLDAQQAMIDAYVQDHGVLCLASYKEQESGKRADRPELLKAIAHAKRSKATLVVARLDRLSRDLEFIAHLMKSGIDFACCDLPVANKLTIHILAAMAEHERELISLRIKQALQQAKRRGVCLGNGGRYLTNAGRARGRKTAAITIREQFNQAYSDLLPIMRTDRERGQTYQQIADRLNADQQTTRRGCVWTATQVMRVLNA